ncbi:DNA repair protein RHP57 [Phaffia rhodozyma]|uniref:DNA repair protein RHP57 n=1 Tax=Phaffia rhodozyma TaxID=264483 RepID=A0A0F7SQW6_PHARH|nr:DNA repair protein RHP57 [Phaffia rhodozyma]
MFDLALSELSTLTPRQKAILRRASLLAPAEILLVSLQKLTKTLKPLSEDEVVELVQAVARGVCGSPVKLGKAREGKVHGARTGWQGVQFGDNSLDELLGGGVRVGEITEIAGQSSTGKTQLCLSLAISVQFSFPTLSSKCPQASGSVAYLSSEGSLPTSRLYSLAEGILARNPELVQSQGISLDSIFDNIHFIQCNDIEALDHTLSYLVPNLASRLSSTPFDSKQPPSQSVRPLPRFTVKPSPLPLKLIVLDSLAALTRSSFTNSVSSLSERSASLSTTADKLRSLAVQHNLAVVVVNQVSDVFDFVTLWGFGSSEGPRPSSTGWTTDVRSNESNSYYAFDQPSESPSKYQDEETLLNLKSLTPTNKVFQLGYKSQTKWSNGSSPHLAKEASLGLVWTNSINTRIMLSRTNRRCASSSLPEEIRSIDQYVSPEAESTQAESGPIMYEEKGVLIRRATVVFSPRARRAERDFVISQSGVFGLMAPEDESIMSECKKRSRPESESDEAGATAGNRSESGKRRVKLGEQEDNQDGLFGDDEWVKSGIS